MKKRSNDGDEFKKMYKSAFEKKATEKAHTPTILLRFGTENKTEAGSCAIRAHIQQFKIRSTTRGVSFGRGTPKVKRSPPARRRKRAEAFKSLPSPPHLANNTITLASAIDKAVFFDIPANLLSFAKPLMARTHPQIIPFKFMDHPPGNGA